jgi:hypothetical protein
MPSIKVNCVKCDHANSFEYKAFKELQFVKCDNCGHHFNLFGVYRSLYDTNPLCKKMVDVAVEHTYAKYFVEASNSEEKNAIIQNLENNHFQEMLGQILHDKVLYGNCFLEMTPKDNIINLQRLEPSELEYTVDWVQREPPARSYHQKIVAIKKHNKPFTEYDIKSILHFKGGSAGVEPIGYSIFGLRFTAWYFLRDVINKYPLLDMQGEKYKDLKEFREFRESIALSAAGIPHRLIFPWMKITNPVFTKIEDDRFQHDIEDKRSEISRKMERKLFPVILKRNYEYENFPRFTWQTSMQ